MEPQSAIRHVRFETPTLPPMAYTMFCLRYEDECRVQPQFRGGLVRLTGERWALLRQINQIVNRSIIPDTTEAGSGVEAWLINPGRGDCNDYAVTKRHELLNRGWPSGALLLSEVVTDWGKHHLILVVRTRSGDLVLDNLTPVIKPWARVPYRWVRIQSPNHARLWTTIADRGECASEFCHRQILPASALGHKRRSSRS
ncbi:transglutaminase-like cysteine peptidase [Bradyrhizobium xenonodulans]|uniref:Transglutaminase-like cysteine peptidase n=1 Tax=Bradyrhizobium xenonodulans TaxID=2736875 RepID=A0ABY7MJC2_9BRAD|nr:transglutaminase-like cysteine peptidase [Bradyrhizobium xenonodulans]WBL78439.1 transglutaminase-like cysteine peptidase [Bradyrhizobium xenonodulans]